MKKYGIRLIESYYEWRKSIAGFVLRIPNYVSNCVKTKVLARPGTCSYKGGIFNPGALEIDGRIVLLAKGQNLQWWKARGKHKQQYLTGGAVLFSLEKDSLKKLECTRVEQLEGFPSNDDWRLGDIRLFQWQGLNMANHSITFIKKTEQGIDQDSTRSALSVYDHSKRVIKYLGVPEVDIELNKFEKNWVYFSKDDRLFLLYSLNPYRLLELDDESGYKFSTIVNEQFRNILENPGGLGTYVSLSANPVDYDDDHWFMLVHQINHKFTGRCYYHWGVWINKTTLLPSFITSRRIFSGFGARGRTPGIRYISSLLKRGSEMLFFAGEGDVFTTVTTLTIQHLDQLKESLVIESKCKYT